jgi:hypothetical protein
VVLAARGLWEEFALGPAIGKYAEQAKLTAPHETALFATAPDITRLPDATGLSVDQCYHALDFLAVWADEIERGVFPKLADLFRLDVDLIFHAPPPLTSRSMSRTRTSRNLPAACMRHCASAAKTRKAVTTSLRCHHARQYAVRSWILSCDTADVKTLERIKDDLRARRLGRCPFVGDAGTYSADNLAHV